MLRTAVIAVVFSTIPMVASEAQLATIGAGVLLSGQSTDEGRRYWPRGWFALAGRQRGLYVGYVPGFPGAHSQGATKKELRENLREVIAMLLEGGEPPQETEFVGTETIRVA
jgi:predicted RNase H-like HicB family nuclease